MNKHIGLAFIYVALMTLAQACASEMRLIDYQKHLYEPKNGVSKEVSLNGYSYRITYWPKKWKRVNGMEEGSFTFFEVKCNEPSELFSKSEADFRALIAGVHVDPSLVFAENTGLAHKNRLLVGFPIERSSADLHFQFLSDQGRAFSTLIFEIDAIHKVEKLSIL